MVDGAVLLDGVTSAPRVGRYSGGTLVAFLVPEDAITAAAAALRRLGAATSEPGHDPVTATLAGHRLRLQHRLFPDLPATRAERRLRSCVVAGAAPDSYGLTVPDAPTLAVLVATKECLAAERPPDPAELVGALDRLGPADVEAALVLAQSVGAGPALAFAMTLRGVPDGVSAPPPPSDPLTDPVDRLRVRLHRSRRALRPWLEGVRFPERTRTVEIAGLELLVGPGVFAAEEGSTTSLRDGVVEALDPGRPGTIADVGTGTGVVALSVARALPAHRCIGTDPSFAAVRIARLNARRLGLDSVVEFRRGSLLDAVPETRLAAVVGNLPYVDPNRPHPAGLPPFTAIGTGRDGLDLLRRTAWQARSRLRAGGILVLQCAEVQHPTLLGFLAELGYQAEPLVGGVVRAHWNPT